MKIYQKIFLFSLFLIFGPYWFLRDELRTVGFKTLGCPNPECKGRIKKDVIKYDNCLCPTGEVKNYYWACTKCKCCSNSLFEWFIIHFHFLTKGWSHLYR